MRLRRLVNLKFAIPPGRRYFSNPVSNVQQNSGSPSLVASVRTPLYVSREGGTRCRLARMVECWMVLQRVHVCDETSYFIHKAGTTLFPGHGMRFNEE